MTELVQGEQLRILVNGASNSGLRAGDIVRVRQADVDDEGDFTVSDPQDPEDYWYINEDMEGVDWERVSAPSAPARLEQRTRTVTEPVIVLELSLQRARDLHDILGARAQEPRLFEQYSALADILEGIDD